MVSKWPSLHGVAIGGRHSEKGKPEGFPIRRSPAMLPINRSSGQGVGMLVQLHFFLDDIFPNTLGKPIF